MVKKNGITIRLKNVYIEQHYETLLIVVTFKSFVQTTVLIKKNTYGLNSISKSF